MTCNDGVVRTSSPIRAWYLTKFRGLRVRAVRVTPVPSFLGWSVYTRCWVLVEAVDSPAAYNLM